mmetsp:Transcript_38301/g.92382  ORF Transcript_38301/g.92382 Transcript_38301/m.92382 type:complete len:280 (+) Transcript_38301:114-953(+)
MTAKQSCPLLLLALSLFHSEVATASSFSRHTRHAAFVQPSSDVSNNRRAHRHEARSPIIERRIPLVTTRLPASPQDDNDSNFANIVGGQSSFTKYGRPNDITASSFGPLLPIAEAVDEATGGWGLSYADLHPATPRTTVGKAFLATNFFYAAAGLWLGFSGDWFYGGLTELAGIVSFVYHYTQLEFGKERSEVRLALLVDYFCAGAALLTGGVYMIQAGITSIPLEALLSAGGAVVCLSLCWVWEFGYPYIFWHSLWHVLSAYTGYLVGQEHLSNIAGG